MLIHTCSCYSYLLVVFWPSAHPVESKDIVYHDFQYYHIFTLQASAFLNLLCFFSTIFRATMIWWPHPWHFNRKSAPTRRISHSKTAAGMFLFQFYNISHFILICHSVTSLYFYTPRFFYNFIQVECSFPSNFNILPKKPLRSCLDDQIGTAVHGVADLLISTSLLPL